MSKHTFKAYDYRGQLVLSTWTSSPATYAVERDAYQTRLNRSELGWVDVSSDDPHEKNYTMHAERREAPHGK